jgi:hypothetical protein
VVRFSRLFGGNLTACRKLIIILWTGSSCRLISRVPCSILNCSTGFPRPIYIGNEIVREETQAPCAIALTTIRELGELTQFLLDFPNLRNPVCLDRGQMAEPELAASDVQMTAPTGEFKGKQTA